MDEKHLTIQDLAEREGVPVKTVYEWNYKGTGPTIMRVGKYVRYRLADVRRWEDSLAAASRGPVLRA